MIWFSALALVCSTAFAGTPTLKFELDGQEFTPEALPEPLRSTLQGRPDTGAVSSLDAPILKFKKECASPDSKICIFRYDLPAVSREAVCSDERSTLGTFLECLEKTGALYQRQTKLAATKLRSYIERFNKLAPAAQQINWTRDVEPQLGMESAGWATREKALAESLGQKISAACVELAQGAHGNSDDTASGPKHEDCPALAANTRFALLEHATKGLVYDQLFNMENTLWAGAKLPENLKVIIGDDGTPKAKPRPLPPKPPKGGLTLKRPKKDHKDPGDLGALKVCADFFPAFKAGSEQGPCIPLTQESLAFQKDVERVMGFASILTYFDILRLEAITAALKSYRDLFGAMPHLPAQCAAFNPSLENANNAPVAADIRDFYRSQAYFDLLKRAGSDVDILSREAAEKGEIAHWIPDEDNAMSDGASMKENPDYRPAQARIAAIENEIAGLFGKFPLLKGFHESGKLLYEHNSMGRLIGVDTSNPVALGELMREPRRQLAAELTKDLGRFCDENETPWDELIQDSGITGSVIEKYPQFKPFQLCALDIAEKEHLPGEMLTVGIGLVCTAAVMGPQAVVGGPVCGAIGLAMAGKTYLDGLEHLSLTEECRAAGDAICTSDDYLGARRDYEAAIVQAITAGVLSIGDVAITISAFKSLARNLKAKELAELTGKIRRVATVEGEATLGRRLREVADLPEGKRIPALNQVLDDALRGGRTELIKELARGADASESEIAGLLGKHYGLSAEDADVKILARAAKMRAGNGLTPDSVSELLDSMLSACRAR